MQNDLKNHLTGGSYAYTEETQIPCKICGQPTPYLGTKLCNGCYEFDKNIDRILNSDLGHQWLNKKIMEHNAKVMGKRMREICELRMLGYEV